MVDLGGPGTDFLVPKLGREQISLPSEGQKNGFSKSSRYPGEHRLGSYEWKEHELQCHSHLSKRGRHVLMVGRKGQSPGRCTSPWSSSSLHLLRRRKPGDCRCGSEDTQHKDKTCQIGWNLQK